jgi:hypothetical protein
MLDFAVGANYIVTDLELRARFDLAPLDVELQRAGLHGWVTHHDSVWRAHYSGSDRCGRNPAQALDHLLQIVEGFDGDSRDMWDRCISRRFDLGYECFDERFASRWQIKAPLLRRLADVKGDLVVTIYRAE